MTYKIFNTTTRTVVATGLSLTEAHNYCRTAPRKLIMLPVSL